ncbi:MAG TPA: hypothetical protein VFZ48_03635 [Candidatus Saccharimonadales bacterium]
MNILVEDFDVFDCENADTDNMLGALAACSPRSGLNVKLVTVSGRFTSVGDMKRIRRNNAARMRGMLDRAGYGHIPVFETYIPPATIVPDKDHVNEELEMDPFGDCQKKKPNGDAGAALSLIRKLARSGRVNIIGAGPLGFANRILQDPALEGRFGIMTCQYGILGFGKATSMHGAGFNGACDRNGGRGVMMDGKIDVYVNTSDTTKDPSVGFKNPQELLKFGVRKEHVDVTQVFWEKAQKPRNEDSYPHDLHPVFLMAQLRGNSDFKDMFAYDEVRVTGVGSKGELKVAFEPGLPGAAKRYVVKKVSAGRFKDMMGHCCR